jgi:hypothetical protein
MAAVHDGGQVLSPLWRPEAGVGRSVTLDEEVFTQLHRAVSDYRLRRDRRPQYVIMDAATFLRCVAASYGEPLDVLELGTQQVRIMGLIAVVIPTDGLPMLRVTGYPSNEAIDLAREAMLGSPEDR